MATLNIKNFPDQLHLQLKARAKRNRRSLRSDVIALLQEAVLRPPPKYTVNDFKGLGGPWKGVDIQKWIDRERDGW